MTATPHPRGMRAPSLTVLLTGLLLSVLLAGCSGGEDDRPRVGGPTDPDPSRTGPDGSEEMADAPDASEGFAVLVATGRLEGTGPSSGSTTAVTACSITAPDGHIDLEEETVWARPGMHSFKAGETWLLVLDDVAIEDPRQSGCGIRALTPFTAAGHWNSRLGDDKFRLDVSPDGDQLLVGRNALGPEQEFETYVEFEDGDYTFKGDLTFRHHGWWPVGSFEEKDEAPEHDDGAVWWA